MSDIPLNAVIRRANILIGSSGPEKPENLEQVLTARLRSHDSTSGSQAPDRSNASLQSLQQATAFKCFHELKEIQAIESSTLPSSHVSESEAPAGVIGSRDLATIRTLLSVAFKWGVQPSYTTMIQSWPTTIPRVPATSHIIDLTGAPEAYVTAQDLVLGMLAFIFPDGVHGPISDTVITVSIIERHLADLLKPALALGWLPKSMSTPQMPVADEIRPKIMRLLSSLPAYQVIPALGALLDQAQLSPVHVRKTCSSLLSRQLLRPDGLHGLFVAFFGKENDQSNDDDEVPLDKLNHVYQVISSVPMHLTAEAYFSIMIPRLIAHLNISHLQQPKRVRPSAFVLSRMLSRGNSFKHQFLVISLIKKSLHDPLLMSGDTLNEDESLLSAEEIISVLATLLANSDPSPTLAAELLSPIIKPLYSIHFALTENRTADPVLRDSADGLLSTWGRLVDTDSCIAVLWDIIDDYDHRWTLDFAGKLSQFHRPQSKLEMLTPESRRSLEEFGDLDIDANVMNIRPDPSSFVSYINSLKRAEIAAPIFVRLLEGYQTLKADDGEPLRILLYLQLIIQMQSQGADSSHKSAILQEPEHLLSFIKNALSSDTNQAQTIEEPDDISTRIGTMSLRVVHEEPQNILGDDSDDEDEPTIDPDIASTAINLLLAILEAHERLSPDGVQTLKEISDRLAVLNTEVHGEVGVLAKEARLVILARLAAASHTASASTSRRKKEDSSQETYQKALKLLQDPILPVRAHGLLLLRQLVSAKPGSAPSAKTLDKALIPGILSIFRQCLEDEDSYIFLNAVQGLSAMVDTFGKEVLTTLVLVYCDGADKTHIIAMTQTDVNKRVRVGEALGQVITRAGATLSSYSDILVPRIFSVARALHFATPVRVSAISLLAQCVKISILAVAPYVRELMDAMVDIIRLEVPAVSSDTKTMDDDPTATNSKVPPIRRSALHFVSLTTRACLESSLHQAFEPALLERLRVTLRYVQSSDSDPIVKVQAKEALEGLDALQGFI